MNFQELCPCCALHAKTCIRLFVTCRRNPGHFEVAFLIIFLNPY